MAVLQGGRGLDDGLKQGDESSEHLLDLMGAESIFDDTPNDLEGLFVSIQCFCKSQVTYIVVLHDCYKGGLKKMVW